MHAECFELSNKVHTLFLCKQLIQNATGLLRFAA